MRDDEPTDFGFQRVHWREKARRVRGVFDPHDQQVDLMNDLTMSGGVHRLWKQFTLKLANLHAGQHALDVAAGTRISPQVLRARSASAGSSH